MHSEIWSLKMIEQLAKITKMHTRIERNYAGVNTSHLESIQIELMSEMLILLSLMVDEINEIDPDPDPVVYG